MAWQDEMRRLDEDLAAGRLPAEDYRRRRDELLARWDSPRADADPFPPPFRWHPGGPGQQSGQGWDAGPDEATQSIPPAWSAPPPDPAGSSETTEVVRRPPFPPAPGGTGTGAGGSGWSGSGTGAGGSGWSRTGGSGAADPDADTDVVPRPAGLDGDPDRTRAVRGPATGPPGPAGPARRTGGAAWQAPVPDLPVEDDGSSPPWGGSELPPAYDAGGSGWFQQGPEVVAPERERPRDPRKIVAGAAVVLILLVIAIGAYLTFGRGSGASQPSPTRPGAVAPLPPDDEGGEKLSPRLFEKGIVEPNTVRTFEDMVRLGFLTDEEVGAYRAASPGAARLLVENFPEGKGTVAVVEVASPEAAHTARDALTDLQLRNSLTRGEFPPQPDVQIAVLPDTAGKPLGRAHYVSGSRVLRLEFSGTDPKQAEADLRHFIVMLLTELQVFSADK